MLDIKVVTIIGGNGTVGKGVAGLFASFGNALVYVVARNLKKAEDAISDASLSVKAMSIKNNLVPKTYEDLEDILKKSDLIFEAVKEDVKIKNEVHRLINKYSKTDAFIASGTSGLSINLLANNYDDEKKKRMFGIHFFNPPYNMTLCELIPGRECKKDDTLLLKDYLEKKLHRDVIITKDTPAFVANRIGFMFMNEALIYAEKYQDVGGIDYIDSVLGCFTGRNMPPIETIDFVGLDVHKAIVDNIYQNTKEEHFLLPSFVNDLIKENKLGLKNGEGLYKKNDNDIFVYDIKMKSYRKKMEYSFPFKEKVIDEFKVGNYQKGFEIIEHDNSLESNLCMMFLLKYLFYAIKISKECSLSFADCDTAMAKGFNWIPPLTLIELFNGKENVLKLWKRFLKNDDYQGILDNVVKSSYDYSRYLKARN